jgi:hypothetical protein
LFCLSGKAPHRPGWPACHTELSILLASPWPTSWPPPRLSTLSEPAAQVGNLEPCVYLCFLLFPFCFPLLPFVSLLFPFRLPLLAFVTLCLPFVSLLFLFQSPFVSLLFPCCLLWCPSVSLLSPCCLPAVPLSSPCCLPLASLSFLVVSLSKGLVAVNTFALQFRKRCERIGLCLAGSQHTRNCAAGPASQFFC